MAERAIQVKMVTVDEDVTVGLSELNQLLLDMQEVGSHEIHSVEPFSSSGRVWKIVYMKDFRGTEDAREGSKEITE